MASMLRVPLNQCHASNPGECASYIGSGVFGVMTSHWVLRSSLVIGSVAVLALLGYHFVWLRNGPSEPPLIKGPIPVLGVALSFGRDPERFLLKCQQQYGDTFSLYLAGKRVHIICDSIDGIPAVFRNFKTFPFSVLTRHIDIRLFGVPENQAKDDALYKANLDRLAPNLLAQTSVETLVKAFNTNLQVILPAAIRKLDVDGNLKQDGIVLDLDVWLRKIMFECSGRTLFGETWPSGDGIFNDYTEWDDGIYDIVKGYPSFLIRKPILARERFYHRLLEMLRKPLVNPNPLILERLKIGEAHGYSFEATVRNMIGVAFALMTNAIPAAFWMIAHLSCLQERRSLVLGRIDQYVIAEESTAESTSFDVPSLLRDPLLNSALSETLRINFRGMNVRGVAETTSLTIGGRRFEYKQGSVLFLPMTCVHKDPAIFDKPDEYQLDRFLEMHSNAGVAENTKNRTHFSKHGVPIRHPLLPWGGGHFMCSGRKFATGEILLFAATILRQFDIVSIDRNIPLKLPTGPPVSRFGGGVEFPARHWRVRLRYRLGEACEIR